jgi:hypothetical protein
MAAPVLSALEGLRVENEFYARFLAKPLSYISEDPLQVIGPFGATTDDGEIEVFGETEGLVVTLTQAGAAFEHVVASSGCRAMPAKSHPRT